LKFGESIHLNSTLLKDYGCITELAIRECDDKLQTIVTGIADVDKIN